jgi:hypothetical protein
MISDFVFSANLFISPIRMAIGALVKTNVPPSSYAFSATFHAIELASSAPVIIPLLPFKRS